MRSVEPRSGAHAWSRDRVAVTIVVLLLTAPSTFLLGVISHFLVFLFVVLPLVAIQISAALVAPSLLKPNPTRAEKIFVLTGLAIGLTPPVVGLMALILAPYYL